MKLLSGITVLDFSHALSGPTCTNMLGMLGATIIKIERPRVGDDFRHYIEHAGAPGMSVPFAAANCGKRSVTLNLKHPEGRRVADRLIDASDMLVENFRPGTMARLGLDQATVRRRNPRIIYCSISGFGQHGRLRDWTAYDNIVQAMCGLARANADPDAPPHNIPFPIIDTFSGYVGVIALLAALERRHQTGEGDYIDVAMLDSAFKLMSTAVTHYFADGTLPKSRRNRGFRLVATSDTYRTRDGYLAIAANHQHQIEAFCRVVGRMDLIEDPRFATHEARVKNFEALKQWLTEFFADQSAEELEPALAAAGVPVARVRNLGQIVTEPHLEQRGTFLDAPLSGTTQTIKAVGPGFTASSQERATNAGLVPRLGEHTDEVLRSIGYSDAEIEQLRAQRVI